MTKLTYIYAVPCILGAILPYTQFIAWVAENGLDVPLLVNGIASSRLAAFGWLDVIVSAVVLFVLILSDGREHHVPFRWLPVVGTLTVGVALSLPMYLLLRESRSRVQA